jgi:hypothetical protein
MRAIGEGMRRFLRSGLWVTIVALLIVAFIWFVPQLQGQYFSQKVPAEDRPALVNEYRRTWAQIIGGFGLLFGLYFTWRRVEIAQDQQVTERFTRAIDQLGATDSTGEKQLETRLGGIYALERIARDSEQDRSPIAEILTAYVRRHASRKGEEKTPAKQQVHEHEGETAQDISPSSDVQAVLTVLVRLSKLDLLPEPLDLSNTDLRGANLNGLHVEGAIFTDADLREALLSYSRFEGSFFGSALLDGAALLNANVPHTLFDGTSLQGTLLYGADLSKAEDLMQRQLDMAEGAKTGKFATHLPDGIHHPRHWPDTWP